MMGFKMRRIPIKVDLHKWNIFKIDPLEQLVDFIELLHNKGIVVISTLFLVQGHWVAIVPFLYGLAFDLKLKMRKDKKWKK